MEAGEMIPVLSLNAVAGSDPALALRTQVP
jgi:hypothetical protein